MRRVRVVTVGGHPSGIDAVHPPAVLFVDTQRTAVLRFDVHDEAIAEQRVAVAEEERELGADGRCVGHHEVSIGPDSSGGRTLLLLGPPSPGGSHDGLRRG